MTPIRMQRVETGVRTILAFTDALNHHDLQAMMKLVRDDCVFEAPTPDPDGTVYNGKSALSQYWQTFLDLKPGVHLKIEESIGYGLRSIILWRCDWTDTSGQAFLQRGVDLFRVQNGLIVEHLSYIKACISLNQERG